ncbi:hypothetical protein BOTBODRAFT_423963 [Botryobasidium botryosum FD-172 SS1]|uniref:Uncharacterized protein n=1 Tax=Botryobasidium botryosum (strain FD-172 SS1) TaxID=930990 RepID=A0A067MKH6_BOTB1|nr:hypothetical protein BOTBODRAFT_423963 [Botryobasidium botryosum FD-172 SS1]
MRATREAFRCPAFILFAVGPYISIPAGAFVDEATVQPLTPLPAKLPYIIRSRTTSRYFLGTLADRIPTADSTQFPKLRAQTIVEFTNRYCAEAPQALAELGLSPKLYSSYWRRADDGRDGMR